MRLRTVYARFFRSLNYDYIRASDDNYAPDPWDDTPLGVDYPFVRLRLEPDVTNTSRTLAYGLRPDGTAMTAHASGGADPLAPSGAEQLAEDGTGSTGLITSPDGTVRCTARYDAYGNPDGNTSTAPTGSCNTGQAANELFYRGNRKDTATGQYQLGSRTYDPAKAAFLTPDTYRTHGSVANAGVGVDPLTRNSYTYVNGDPINYTDPSGHKPECGDGKGCKGRNSNPLPAPFAKPANYDRANAKYLQRRADGFRREQMQPGYVVPRSYFATSNPNEIYIDSNATCWQRSGSRAAAMNELVCHDQLGILPKATNRDRWNFALGVLSVLPATGEVIGAYDCATLTGSAKMDGLDCLLAAAPILPSGAGARRLFGDAAEGTPRGLFDVRAPNAAHPPNANVTAAMRGNYHPCYDCSEIAEDLLAAAGGKGRILTYTPPKGGTLRTPESGGRSIQDFVYHEVYTDGRYAYDPRFSSTPVPLGDYNRMLRGLNPGVRAR